MYKIKVRIMGKEPVYVSKESTKDFPTFTQETFLQKIYYLDTINIQEMFVHINSLTVRGFFYQLVKTY